MENVSSLEIQRNPVVNGEKDSVGRRFQSILALSRRHLAVRHSKIPVPEKVASAFQGDRDTCFLRCGFAASLECAALRRLCLLPSETTML